MSVGDGAAVVEGRIFVGEAGLDNLEAAGFEGAADLCGELQNDFGFADAAGAARAGVGAAVGGVEDDVQMLRPGRGAGGCGV